MTLCNQGCGTHVVFINGKPYNQDRKTPHSETCMSLKFGKWWGGKYNTIPMNKISGQITTAYESLSQANKSRNIEEILKAFQLSLDLLQEVNFRLTQQAERNHKWAEEFDEYKVNLVREQKDREEQKEPHFVRADEL